MRLSIGALAKAFNLSDEALRYYEKKGFLHPRREGSGRYRIFEKADIQRIANIKRMQNQDFSLDEILSIYSGSSEGTLAGLYQQKAQRFRQEIAYRQRMLLHIQETASLLERLPYNLNQPETVRLDTVFLLEYSSIDAMWTQIAKEPLLKYLFQHLPLTSFTTIVPRAAASENLDQVRKGILLRRQDAQVLHVDVTQLRAIDARRAVSCLFRVESGRFDVKEPLSLVLGYLESQDLALSDDLFTIQLANFIDGQGQPVHYSRLLAPVIPRSRPAT